MAGLNSVLKYTRPDLAGLVYHPVRPLDVISQEIGVPVKDIAKLDANENLHPVPAEMMAAVNDALSALDSGCSAQIYPDPTQTNFRDDIAKLHGIDASQVCGGSGSDDILDIIMRLTVADTCIICPPTFGMYKFLGALTKIKIIEVARKPNFEVDVPAVVKAIRDHKCKLVMLPSPNNPTGTLLPNSDIRTLCAEDALVVVDEAYADFAGCSADELLGEFSNLVVCRTFSKWAGLAGLRVGYALGHPAFIERMLAIKQPYNVNVAAEAMARAALKHRPKILITVKALLAERDATIAFLQDYRFLSPHATHSNFVLCDVVDADASALHMFLRYKGVLVRYFGTQGGQLQNNIRISAGRPEDTQRLLAALKEFEALRWHQPAFDAIKSTPPFECVLFDVDGVLVDVSKSFRQAILDTAKHFGAEVTSADIGAAKAKGGSNNDWKLTHSLLEAKGISPLPTLEQVTEKFEEIYQGANGKLGLKATEKLLPPRALLENLAKKFPLGVVTGRPLKDLDYFLDTFNLRSLFKACATMEDGIKPDPAPVTCVLSKMGCKSAILLGDTVDDCRAAVAAGIVAMGVVAPGHTRDTDEPVLAAAGATCTLSEGMAELRALL